MCFFRKKRAKKKALQEEQLKMQQESKKKSATVAAKPVPKKETVEEKSAPKVEPVKAKPQPEKPVKAEASTDDNKSKKYHVSQNKDAKSKYFKSWRVRKEGSAKTIKYFDTQAEAIDYAQDLADNNNSSIVIHKLDGSIRKQEY